MKMKKAISALVLGAAAVGFATADLKLELNYRNGADMFRYYNDREKVNKTKEKTLFDLVGWNNGSDGVNLIAKGNIFSYKVTLNPKVGTDDGGFTFKTMQIRADVGDFFFDSGWQADGVMNYRVKKDGDAGNEEAMVFERYKLGSTLGGLSSTAENQVSFGGTGNNYYAQTGYKFGFGDSVSLRVKVAAISNHTWGNASQVKTGPQTDSSLSSVNLTALSEKDEAGTKGMYNYAAPYLGWSVFLEPEFKGILGAEVFAKGQRQNEDRYGFVFGGYAKLLCLPVLNDSALGGAVGMSGGKITEWSADLRLYFKLGDSISLTTMNNFTMALRDNLGRKPLERKDNGTATGLAGLDGFDSSTLLWDMVALRFKLNDTLTIIGAVGQQTDFDSGTAKDGTQIFVHPHAQIYAGGNTSVSVGVVGALGGLGANKSKGEKFDVLVRVPVLFRVRM